MQTITSKIVADKLTAYLHGELTISELVDWAENIVMEDDFEQNKFEVLRKIVSRLGVADVKAFGLTWEDCEQFLTQLGYKVRVEVTAN